MTLSRKLVRDLWESKAQYLAVAVVVALGVAFFGASYMSYRNLADSYGESYQALKFEDFSITFHDAPRRVVNRIRTIPGLKSVEGRLVQDVAVELEGDSSRKLIGRLISIPVGRRLTVDDLMVSEGRFPTDRTAREVLLEAGFARNHSLHPGAAVDVIDRGTRTRLKVVGTVKSAEFIYVVRSKQDIMPSPDTFGVMFLGEDLLGQLVNKPDTITEIKARVQTSKDRQSVIREAQRLLSAYRPELPVVRQDQPSFQLLENDLEGFQMYAVFFPAMFLGVAALTIYSLLTRLVHSQRTIIGLMRALGLSKAQVVRHFLAASMAIGVVASIAGTVVGFWLSAVFTRYYVGFLTTPVLVSNPHWGTMAAGVVLGCAVCLVAGFQPAMWAAGIDPAASMRPEPPIVGRVIRIDSLIPGLSLMNRIPLRSLLRQPRRTLTTLAGVIASLSLIVTARGLQDSMDALMGELSASIFREDLRLDFIQYEDRTVVESVRTWKGVTWVEGELDLPMTFRKGSRSYDALAVGVPDESRLRSLFDAHGNPLRPTENGAIVGQTLRRRLSLERGDMLTMELPRSMLQDAEPQRTPIRVLDFNDEPVGTLVYLRQTDLRSAVKRELDIPGGGITSIRVLSDPKRTEELRKRLLKLELAGAVSSTRELQQMFEDQMALMRRFINAMLLFGATLAFVVMFNMVTINVIERESEVATMRTLGIGRFQIGWMVTQENLWLCALGSVVGVPIGKWMCNAFLQGAQTEEQQELFTITASVGTATLWIGVALVVVAAMLAQISPLVRLGKLNLAAVLKKGSR